LICVYSGLLADNLFSLRAVAQVAFYVLDKITKGFVIFSVSAALSTENSSFRFYGKFLSGAFIFLPALNVCID